MRESDENISFFSGILIEHDFLYVRGFEPEMRVCVCVRVWRQAAQPTDKPDLLKH